MGSAYHARVTPSEFADKWRGSTRNERAASQVHFIDLCGMLGWGTPNTLDPEGTWYDEGVVSGHLACQQRL